MKAIIILLLCVFYMSDGFAQLKSGWYTFNNKGVKIESNGKTYFVDRTPVTDLKDIMISKFEKGIAPGGDSCYIITMVLKPEQAEKFHKFTQRSIGQEIGFILDGKLIQTATINNPVEFGFSQLMGKDEQLFTEYNDMITSAYKMKFKSDKDKIKKISKLFKEYGAEPDSKISDKERNEMLLKSDYEMVVDFLILYKKGGYDKERMHILVPNI